jgi:NADH dehydrogenase
LAGEKIVVLGAGVAGLRVAQKTLSKIRRSEASVTLIDENPYHQLLYKLHEVCNKEYQEKDIIVPLERLIKGIDIDFIQASVERVDTEAKLIHTSQGAFTYDVLVIALGSHPAYFNIEGIQEHSMSLGSYPQAMEIRKRIAELFKAAGKTGVPPRVVIGGAGFTGVELAGKLADCLPSLYKKHGLDIKGPIFSIVEAYSGILPG